MKLTAVFAALLSAAPATWAAIKPCEELKSEIAKKLDAKGVKSYSLDIVDKDKQQEGTVAGACEGGAKKIVYLREAAAKQSAPAPKK